MIRARRLALTFVGTLLLGPSSAFPQESFDAAGLWVGKQGKKSIKMNVLQLNEEGAVAAEILIGQPGCSGAIAGVGEIKDMTLSILPYNPDKELRECTVTIRFDSKRSVAELREEGCLDYHGAQCTFAGQVRKQRIASRR